MWSVMGGTLLDLFLLFSNDTRVLVILSIAFLTLAVEIWWYDAVEIYKKKYSF